MNDYYQIEKDLNELPDKVADALLVWRTATLNREKIEALLYMEIKGADGSDLKATEIKAVINASQGRYNVCLEEVKAESEYNRLYEKLLAAKKIASLRVAI